MMDEKEKHYHITDPFWPLAPRWFFAAWRRVFCEHGIHLLDEIGSNDDTGYCDFVCDACKLQVEANKIR